MQGLTKNKQNCSWKGAGGAKDHKQDVIWLPVLRSLAMRSEMVSGWNDPGFCKVDVEERWGHRELRVMKEDSWR